MVMPKERRKESGSMSWSQAVRSIWVHTGSNSLPYIVLCLPSSRFKFFAHPTLSIRLATTPDKSQRRESPSEGGDLSVHPRGSPQYPENREWKPRAFCNGGCALERGKGHSPNPTTHSLLQAEKSHRPSCEPSLPPASRLANGSNTLRCEGATPSFQSKRWTRNSYTALCCTKGLLWTLKQKPLVSLLSIHKMSLLIAWVETGNFNHCMISAFKEIKIEIHKI